jgi:hypothetical protein
VIVRLKGWMGASRCVVDVWCVEGQMGAGHREQMEEKTGELALTYLGNRHDWFNCY